jgi:hypothetical protein
MILPRLPFPDTGQGDRSPGSSTELAVSWPNCCHIHAVGGKRKTAGKMIPGGQQRKFT